MVQWLRLHAPNAGDMGSILGQGTEITYAAIKSLHTAATGPDDSAKIPCAGIAKEIKKIFKNRREAPSCFFFITNLVVVLKGSRQRSFHEYF